MPAVELLRRLGTEGGPRALLVHGANPAVSAPNVSVVREALGRLDLLVVADVVPSETALMADVVLPVTQWAEEEGTMTTLEGRVVRRRKAIDPPGDARSELWLWAELARRAGHHLADDAREVFDELARGLGRWPRRLLRRHVRPPRRRRGALLAVLDRGARGHAAPVPRRVPHGRRPGAPRRRRAPRPRRRRHLRPARPPRDRPRAAPLPVGRADPPRRRAASRPHPSRSPSCTPCSPTASASPTGMPCASPPPAAPSSRPPR